MSIIPKYETLPDLLKGAEKFGFTQEERHAVADVYREGKLRAWSLSERDQELAGLLIAEQYMAAEIDKWQRKGYVVKDGKHVRPEVYDAG